MQHGFMVPKEPKADARASGANLRSVRRAAVLVGVMLAIGGGASVLAPKHQSAHVQPATATGGPSSVFDWRSLRGRPTVVTFLQTNCSSCAADLQILSAVGAEAPHVHFVAVESSGQSAASLANFAQQVGATAAIDYTEDPSGTGISHCRIRALDTVLVLDAAGKVRARLNLPNLNQVRGALREVTA